MGHYTVFEHLSANDYLAFHRNIAFPEEFPYQLGIVQKYLQINVK